MEATTVTAERVHPTAPIDILLVGEQRVLRDALRKLFEGEPGFNVVGDASDAGQALNAIRELSPDVVIVNLPGRRLAGMMPAMEDLTAAGSHARTILLTTTIEKTHILQAQELGVSGILVRETPARVLFESVKSVAAGHCWLGRKPLEDLGQARRHLIRVRKNRFELTERELEVVQAVLRADTNKSIASRLSITEEAVKYHLSNIFTKVGVFTRLQLAVFAMNHKLTPDAVVVRTRPAAKGARGGGHGHHGPVSTDRHSRTVFASVASPVT